jgi:sec-independent protein translocase protein TatA
MFGIGGGELFFIILVAIMLFGSKNIPEVARTIAKGIAQLKNATDEIKNEVQKSAEQNGFDKKSLTGGFSEEIDKVKQGFNNIITENTSENPLKMSDITSDIATEINKAKENIEDLSGPIKRIK